MLEETPAPGLTEATREKLKASAVLLAKAVNYASAGTVEFIYDDDTEQFYFLEVNTRLQVEHGVTEEVTGFDLVEWMVLQAAGEMPPLESFKIAPQGASIEARVYAEDPANNFQPTPGKLTLVNFPAADVARVETWIESGTTVTSFYDPMIAKIIVHGRDRTEALEKMAAALEATAIDGTETNLRYLREVLADAGVCIRERLQPHFWVRLRLLGGRLRCSMAGRRRPSRTIRDALAIGTWACRLRDRWTIFRFALRTSLSATERMQRRSSLPRWADGSSSMQTR